MSLLGVNLVGAEFNISGRAYPSKATIDYYKSKNLNLMRVPFRWEFLQPVLGGPLDATELNALMTTLQYIQSLKANVISDVHNFGHYGFESSPPAIGSSPVPVSAYIDFITKLATELKTLNPTFFYGLDIMNEPHDLPQSWQSVAQQAATAIRGTGAAFPLVVEGDDWSSCTTWASSQPNFTFEINDPNWIPSTHLYCDYGHGEYPVDTFGSYSSIKTVNGYTGASPTMAVSDAQAFFKYLAQGGHRKGLIGEFGVPSWPRANDQANAPQLWNAVADNLFKACENAGVDLTWWGGGEWQIIGLGGPDYGQPTYVTSCNPQSGVDSLAVQALGANDHKP